PGRLSSPRAQTAAPPSSDSASIHGLRSRERSQAFASSPHPVMAQIPTVHLFRAENLAPVSYEMAGTYFARFFVAASGTLFAVAHACAVGGSRRTQSRSTPCTES